MPESFATCFTCLIFLPLMTLLDAPSTVKSFEMTATGRWCMDPNPVTLPSAGLLSRTSARCDVDRRPDSKKLPASSK